MTSPAAVSDPSGRRYLCRHNIL